MFKVFCFLENVTAQQFQFLCEPQEQPDLKAGQTLTTQLTQERAGLITDGQLKGPSQDKPHGTSEDTARTSPAALPIPLFCSPSSPHKTAAAPTGYNGLGTGAPIFPGGRHLNKPLSFFTSTCLMSLALVAADSRTWAGSPSGNDWIGVRPVWVCWDPLLWLIITSTGCACRPGVRVVARNVSATDCAESPSLMT